MVGNIHLLSIRGRVSPVSNTHKLYTIQWYRTTTTTTTHRNKILHDIHVW